MDAESRERLRLDRRLIRRRGYIAADELEKSLADLPDVAHKAVPLVVEEPPGPEESAKEPERERGASARPG
jgi:hypothetical protein